MDQHWLTQPRTVRRLWQGFIAILVLTVLAGLAVEAHPHFAVERVFGGYAIYGFVACAALIVIAKVIGFVVKRPESYYRD